MMSITVIGSLNMDLVVRTARTPQAGETLVGKDFHLIPGGKGANQAVAAARSGAPTHMLGCVGKDAFGRVLLDSLIAAGVKVDGVSRLADVSSGTATIIVEDSGENRIIIIPGANGMVSEEYIRKTWNAILKSDLLLLQHEIPLPTLHYILERGHQSDLKVILNPSPVYPIPDHLWVCIDTLIMNELEAAAYTGMAVTGMENARDAARHLLGFGVATVIITLGSNGAILYSHELDLHQPAFKVKVVDTTAAGDSFAGGYAAAILKGRTPAEALLYASAAAALTVTRLGAQSSIPSRDEVESLITSQAGKI